MAIEARFPFDAFVQFLLGEGTLFDISFDDPLVIQFVVFGHIFLHLMGTIPFGY